MTILQFRFGKFQQGRSCVRIELDGRFLAARDERLMSASRLRHQVVAVLAIALAMGSLAYLAKGFTLAWQGGDSDLRIREREWADFSRGIYPNLRFTPEGEKPAAVHSVYPAYALPMFGLFFGAGDFVGARIVLQALSLAGLAAMMLVGWKALRCHGWQAGFLGMAMASAMSGNCTAIALGQFSILCAGLLAGQILAIQANRPWLAGAFWAFAMIKPQIALPFALLFLIQRQWIGMLVGGAILTGLSFFSLEWTGWRWGEYLVHSIGSESLSFVPQSKTGIIAALPVSPRVITALGIALIGLIGLWLVLARGGLTQDKLWPLAGLATALGWVLFYHRPYDNPMLFPLLLAIAIQTLRDPKIPRLVVAGLLGITVYLPASLVFKNQPLSLLAFAVPMISAILLFLPSKAMNPGFDLANAGRQ